MPHDNSEFEHPHNLLPSDPELRVKALETILVRKGLVDPAARDAIIDTYENRIGPQNGARIVAKSWCDDDFRRELLEDATSAANSLGYSGRQGGHVVAVENTPDLHNVVVCTLCSCYPWPLLGVPPAWYKSDAYRSRMVREPRQVLLEFGLEIERGRKVRVWDSTAEIRYLVVPMRPAGTENLGENELAKWVTRDSMVGTGLPACPETA
ncbi:MAG: nitrile hydratase subunit alpha [Albidovulum sp.]|nr:nitrile hydratase subunit alpha [Albidovulum sp.]